MRKNRESCREGCPLCPLYKEHFRYKEHLLNKKHLLYKEIFCCKGIFYVQGFYFFAQDVFFMTSFSLDSHRLYFSTWQGGKIYRGLALVSYSISFFVRIKRNRNYCWLCFIWNVNAGEVEVIRRGGGDNLYSKVKKRGDLPTASL